MNEFADPMWSLAPPLRGWPHFGERLPRAALRLPWAILLSSLQDEKLTPAYLTAKLNLIGQKETFIRLPWERFPEGRIGMRHSLSTNAQGEP
jgi:hypothetical protein